MWLLYNYDSTITVNPSFFLVWIRNSSKLQTHPTNDEIGFVLEVIISEVNSHEKVFGK